MTTAFGLRRGLPPTHELNIESPHGIDITGHLTVLQSLVAETKNPDNTLV